MAVSKCSCWVRWNLHGPIPGAMPRLGTMLAQGVIVFLGYLSIIHYVSDEKQAIELKQRLQGLIANELLTSLSGQEIETDLY